MHKDAKQEKRVLTKNLIKKKTNKIRKYRFTNSYLYEQLEQSKETIKDKNIQLIKKEEKYKAEIKNLNDEIIKLKKELDQSDYDKEQINEIHKNLHRIHIQAEAEADDLIYDAKGKVMEIFFVVEKINEQIDALKKDLKYLEKDLKIGTTTTYDRIELFYKDVSKYQSKLNKLKKDFYKENKVPLE